VNKPDCIIGLFIIAIVLLGCQSAGLQMVIATSTLAPPTDTPTAMPSPTPTQTPTATPTPAPVLFSTSTATPTPMQEAGIYPGVPFELALTEQEVTDTINPKIGHKTGFSPPRCVRSFRVGFGSNGREGRDHNRPGADCGRVRISIACIPCRRSKVQLTPIRRLSYEHPWTSVHC
jgi:hypothetical protein